MTWRSSRQRFAAGSHGPVLEIDAVDFCRTLSGQIQGDGLMQVKVLF